MGNIRGEFRGLNNEFRLHESTSPTHLFRPPTWLFLCVPHYVAELLGTGIAAFP
jgi:hypothetical protein